MKKSILYTSFTVFSFIVLSGCGINHPNPSTETNQSQSSNITRSPNTNSSNNQTTNWNDTNTNTITNNTDTNAISSNHNIISLQEMRLGPIGLGDSKQSVLTKLGNPSSISKGINPTTKTKIERYQYQKNGITVVFDAKTNNVIMIYSPIPTDFKTPNKIGIDSSLSEIEKAYRNYPHLIINHGKFGGYDIFTSDKSAYIGFGLAQNRVITIVVAFIKYDPLNPIPAENEKILEKVTP